MSWLGGLLNKVKDVALPVLGTALLGPAGGVLGGALAGSIGHGAPKLSNIAGGAVSGGVSGLTGGIGGSLAKNGVLKTVGGSLLKNAPAVLGAASLAQGAQTQGKANKMADQALQGRIQQYNEFAPIRALGLQGLQNTQRPDLTPVYQNRSNPFAYNA